MNLAEILLAADAGKIKEKATKKIEVPRLSALLGEPFVLDVCQIPNRRIRELKNMSTKIDHKGRVSFDQGIYTSCILTSGIANPEFDSKELLKKYDVATKKELFDVLFNAAEALQIVDIISGLNGFDDTSQQVVEVKN